MDYTTEWNFWRIEKTQHMAIFLPLHKFVRPENHKCTETNLKCIEKVQLPTIVYFYPIYKVDYSILAPSPKAF